MMVRLFLGWMMVWVLSAQLQAQVAEPEMVFVEGGTFQMGTAEGTKKELPVHAVTLHSFYIGKYEITQNQWVAVMGTNPSTFNTCGQCPVEQATPAEINAFIAKLNTLTGKKYRLPTEAEWEYAAIGGNKSKGFTYPGSNKLDDVAWHVSNAGGITHPVGELKPNELGIYDMAGNVWELCSDWFAGSYYKRSPPANPLNTKKALYRVVRGGSWKSASERCYNQARNINSRHHRTSNMGFRLVLEG
jgi:formylglycine-generating enzyme required for sulfatase activity